MEDLKARASSKRVVCTQESLVMLLHLLKMTTPISMIRTERLLYTRKSRSGMLAQPLVLGGPLDLHAMVTAKACRRGISS
jgi:hypothetical protein